MTKQKIEDRIKQIKDYNKASTVIAQVNNKSPIKIDFNNIEKLTNYNNLNYELLREVFKITTANSSGATS